MRKHHPENERVKRECLIYLEQAKRMSTPTVDAVASSIALFEEARIPRFSQVPSRSGDAFKDRLQNAVNKTTGEPLAKSTVHSRLIAMKEFIIWLQGQPG